MSVLDDGGDPPGGCSPCPLGEILPIGRPGVHQMNVGVDHPGEDQQPGRVDHVPRRRDIADGDDATSGHPEVGDTPPIG